MDRPREQWVTWERGERKGPQDYMTLGQGEGPCPEENWKGASTELLPGTLHPTPRASETELPGPHQPPLVSADKKRTSGQPG